MSETTTTISTTGILLFREGMWVVVGQPEGAPRMKVLKVDSQTMTLTVRRERWYERAWRWVKGVWRKARKRARRGK